MANTNLKEAKAAKNDEFYTQFHDIEIEMNAYLEYRATNAKNGRITTKQHASDLNFGRMR